VGRSVVVPVTMVRRLNASIHSTKYHAYYRALLAQRNAMPSKIYSFGYKHYSSGRAPVHHSQDGDLGTRLAKVIDVRRFLSANPHNDLKLRSLTGKDDAVQAFFWGIDTIHGVLDGIRAEIGNFSGDIYLGCTGGKHRSVFVAEDMARRFGCPVEHLDIDKP